MPSSTVNMNSSRIISDEIQELINHKPHWMVKYGNVVFFLILGALLTMCWFIRYPDIVKGSLRLEAINAPKLLVAKTEGNLERLLVVNEQEVKQGQPLAYLSSSGSHEQVLALQKWISQIEPYVIKGDLDILLSMSKPVFNRLGDIQTVYQEFQNQLKETLETLSSGYYSHSKEVLLKDMGFLAAIGNNADSQQFLLMQDLDLQRKEYSMDEYLAKEKVIASLEMNQNRSKLLGKEQNLRLVNDQRIGNQMNSLNKKKELLDLEKYIGDQHQKFKSELLSLKSKVEEWIQRYIVAAPESGKVLFTTFLQENQLCRAGQEMFYVQPRQSLYYGQMTASQVGLGKIRVGQRVLIRMESFPSSEFGYLKGVISYISNIPTIRDSFLVKVDLPGGLKTSYDKTIYFRNNLMGGAEVITDDRRLLQRFLGGVDGVVNR